VPKGVARSETCLAIGPVRRRPGQEIQRPSCSCCKSSSRIVSAPTSSATSPSYEQLRRRRWRPRLNAERARTFENAPQRPGAECAENGRLVQFSGARQTRGGMRLGSVELPVAVMAEAARISPNWGRGRRRADALSRNLEVLEATYQEQQLERRRHGVGSGHVAKGFQVRFATCWSTGRAAFWKLGDVPPRACRCPPGTVSSRRAAATIQFRLGTC
jgi:hypothetical protein